MVDTIWDFVKQHDVITKDALEAFIKANPEADLYSLSHTEYQFPIDALVNQGDTEAFAYFVDHIINDIQKASPSRNEFIEQVKSKVLLLAEDSNILDVLYANGSPEKLEYLYSKYAEVTGRNLLEDGYQFSKDVMFYAARDGGAEIASWMMQTIIDEELDICLNAEQQDFGALPFVRFVDTILSEHNEQSAIDKKDTIVSFIHGLNRQCAAGGFPDNVVELNALDNKVVESPLSLAVKNNSEAFAYILSTVKVIELEENGALTEEEMQENVFVTVKKHLEQLGNNLVGLRPEILREFYKTIEATTNNDTILPGYSDNDFPQPDYKAMALKGLREKGRAHLQGHVVADILYEQTIFSRNMPAEMIAMIARQVDESPVSYATPQGWTANFECPIERQNNRQEIPKKAAGKRIKEEDGYSESIKRQKIDNNSNYNNDIGR